MLDAFVLRSATDDAFPTTTIGDPAIVATSASPWNNDNDNNDNFSTGNNYAGNVTEIPAGNHTGNSTLTCVGTVPATDVLGQIIFYLCWVKDRLFAFLRTLPLDFPVALGLFCGVVALALLLFLVCCCCCCKRCCCGGGKIKKKRKQNRREYDYLDPKLAPALKSRKNPKTAFDRLPLIGSYIQEKVQPSLYDIPETQMRMSRMSGEIAPAEEGEVKQNYGRIQFSLKKSGSRKTPDITVGVVQAVELDARQQSKTGDSPDAYISIDLQANKKDSKDAEVFETRIIKDETDPMFQETFVFSSVNKLEDKTLIFRAWHFDRIAVEQPPIGELVIEMSKFDLSRPVEEWHKLKEPDANKWEKYKKTRLRFGCLCLSLQYVPVVSKLTICVLEAKDLPKTQKENDPEKEQRVNVEPTIDPMVKLSIKLDGKKVDKKKTGRKKNTANPYYNEILHFTVAPEHVKFVELTVSMVDCHGFGLSDTVGRIGFGPFTAGRERQHWEDMMENQGRPVAQWHILADPRQKKHKPQKAKTKK